MTNFDFTIRNVGKPNGRPTWWPSHQTDDDFGGRVKNPVPFLAVRGPVHEILGRCRGPFVVYIAVSRLSISCSFRRYWPSKFPSSCKVVENRSTVFWTPIFCGVEDLKILKAVCYRGLLRTVWQSLIEFCGLKCVCEARQWRITQNFQRVGENSHPIFRR